MSDAATTPEHLSDCDGVWPCSCVTRVEDVAPTPTMLAQMRLDAYDLGGCPNGPDEYGNYPCDPKVLYGVNEAECQTCGRVARWGGDDGS